MISESTVRGIKIRASRLISRPILLDFQFRQCERSELLFHIRILRQFMLLSFLNFGVKIQTFDTATQQKKMAWKLRNRCIQNREKNDDIFSHRFRNFSSQAMSHFRSAFLRIC